MKLGKLTDSELQSYIFTHIHHRRDEVLLSSGVGIDTGVLDLGEHLAVLSIDPITGSESELGSLAINVSANDVASEGAEPVGVLLSVLAPPTATLEALESIMIQADEQAARLHLEIIGGHTEVTDAVNRIVVTSMVIGKLRRDHLMDPKAIEPGDVVCVSKEIAIEGTMILKDLKPITLTAEEMQAAEGLASKLSVVKEAASAMACGVKFMHDITEGGVYGALIETAHSIDKALRIEKACIPIGSLQRRIAEAYEIDPYRLISSGSMVMIFSKDDFKRLRSEVAITAIGTVEEGSGVTLISDEGSLHLTETTTDELYRALQSPNLEEKHEN
ncbi:AIR synthase related protein [Peptoniphilus equinus]|uniref:AIR synthase related protein n=1 Tax=Peptoniphilus equinus TaxID=3016343 RepID=A0ABY7QR66_9FIRM|nr:AIR synthase related protein [Peptoniphilus equinus]WBW49281.1 AIR synthase related protein [Peptoniphilus equinus]